MSSQDAAALNAKSWPFEQARALLKRVGDKKLVTFQTGFGPSGAPHVGTFGEIVRTNMVRQAFIVLTRGTVETRLIVFSDDMDGLRKVPTNLPEDAQALLSQYIDYPLTSVPDPFGVYSSYAERNNTLLREFVDSLGIDYEFKSATECYRSGVFNDVLGRIYDNYDAVQAIMLPTLGEERRATYSPFLPIGDDGRLIADASVELAPPVPESHVETLGRAMITFDDPSADYANDIGDRSITHAGNGNVKLQWKVDWAARWIAFGVDYEMHGKDLIESAVLSTRICKALGAKSPLNYVFEMFLDDEGRKYSKSRGGGFTYDDWMRYSSQAALMLFMFENPRAAKVFSAKVVPRVTDDYMAHLRKYFTLSGSARLDSPIWHIHHGNAVESKTDATYGLFVNLATVAGKALDLDTMIAYVQQYKYLSRTDLNEFIPLIAGAMNYAEDHVLNERVLRDPTETETKAFHALADRLDGMADGLDAEAYQAEVYAVGKEFDFQPLRAWFVGLYEVLFGADQGPRFGSFIAAYGRENSIRFLRERAGAV